MRQAPDFPYYNGQPTAISGWGWLLVLAATAIAFMLLVAPFMQFGVFPLTLIPAIVFVGLPLAALRLVAGPHWTALFHAYGPKQWALSLGFAALTIGTTIVVGLILKHFIPMTENPSADILMAAGPLVLAEFLLATLIQLVGEELTTILPLLAVLWLCVSVFRLPRTAGIVVAVIVSTVWFASLHLPTYDWNILQCLLGIGAARLVLTASFLVTRNLWVSAGAHILNDWSIFVASFAPSHMPIGT